MNNKNYLSAMAGIDEELIARAERKNEVNTVSKKIKAKKLFMPIAACLVLAFVAVWCIKITDIPEEESTGTVNNTQDDFANHAGDGNTGRVDIVPGSENTDNLTVSTNLNGSVFFASGLDYSDPYSEENKKAEKKAERAAALSELMNIAGLTDIAPEYGPDDLFPYVDTGDAVIKAIFSYFGIETDCIAGVTAESPDSDIIARLTENRYTSALMKYIGLDPENLFVYRDAVFMYGDSDENTEPLSKMTTFKIVNNSNEPQRLAFELNTDYLMFKITEQYNENTVLISSVYGYYISKNNVRETTEYLSYDEALKSVSQQDSFDADKSICAVIYKPDTEKGELLPYYEFRRNTEDGEQSICIPLITKEGA